MLPNCIRVSRPSSAEAREGNEVHPLSISLSGESPDRIGISLAGDPQGNDLVHAGLLAQSPLGVNLAKFDKSQVWVQLWPFPGLTAIDHVGWIANFIRQLLRDQDLLQSVERQFDRHTEKILTPNSYRLAEIYACWVMVYVAKVSLEAMLVRIPVVPAALCTRSTTSPQPLRHMSQQTPSVLPGMSIT